MVLHMKKIIAITGPESSGKTELCAHLQRITPHSEVVPEYARTYLESKPPGYVYQWNDLVHIAHEQHRQIMQARSGNVPVVYCDSDYFVLLIWMKEVFGKSIPELEDWILAARFDSILLCKPDVPWIADPLRENPHDRDRLFDLYVHELNSRSLDYTLVEGLGEQRERSARSGLLGIIPSNA